MLFFSPLLTTWEFSNHYKLFRIRAYQYSALSQSMFARLLYRQGSIGIQISEAIGSRGVS